MKMLQKIGFWGMRRMLLWELDPAACRFAGRLLFARQKHTQIQAEAVFPKFSELVEWTAQFPDYPIFIYLSLEEVVEGFVDKKSSDWITDVLGVKVAQPSLFWCQVKEDVSDNMRVAVIRKALLENNMAKWAAIENRLIGFSLFKQEEEIQFFRTEYYSQPKQLIENKVHVSKSFWISRLTLAVSCFSLVVSLSFLLLTQSIQHKTQHRQQQTAASQEQLDSIRHNEALLAQQSSMLLQSQQLSPSAFSYSADQLAAIAPENLRFEKLIFRPDKQDRKLLSPLLKNDSLAFLLAGTASEAQAITELSSQMEKLDFVEKVNLLETPFEQESKTYRFVLAGEFEKEKR